jgi:hypothetical protein
LKYFLRSFPYSIQCSINDANFAMVAIKAQFQVRLELHDHVSKMYKNIAKITSKYASKTSKIFTKNRKIDAKTHKKYCLQSSMLCSLVLTLCKRFAHCCCSIIIMEKFIQKYFMMWKYIYVIFIYIYINTIIVTQNVSFLYSIMLHFGLHRFY